MADQTYKLTTNDVATVSAELAVNLWITEFEESPKASDAKFLKLVAICSWALQGKHNPEDIEKAVRKTFGDSND
ncbi:hypothetical protein [Celeribacter halophilus]|uniref:hypothetical protein n=1 Tax=Celeribacter halophilus TaxID=576117 RepID=UPI002FD25E49